MKALNKLKQTLQRLRAGVDQFMNWWLTELVSMLPKRVRTMANPPAYILELDAQGGQIRSAKTGKDENEPARLSATSATLTTDGLAAFFKPFMGKSLLVRLGAPWSLETRFACPDMSRTDAQKAALLQADTLFPIPSDRLVVASADHLCERHLPIAAVKRRDLDTILKAGRSLSLDIREFTSADGRFRFRYGLPPLFSSRQSAMLFLFFCGFAAAFLLSRQGFQWWAQGQETVIHEQTLRLNSQAQLYFDQRRKLSKLEQIEHSVSSTLKAPTPLYILNSLTETLPGDAWVRSVQVQGHTLTMQGQATSPSDLVPRLEQTGQFSDVSLSITSRGQGELTDFAIRARLVGMEETL